MSRKKQYHSHNYVPKKDVLLGHTYILSFKFDIIETEKFCFTCQEILPHLRLADANNGSLTGLAHCWCKLCDKTKCETILNCMLPVKLTSASHNKALLLQFRPD